jgi:hypothetical protein
MDIMNEEVKLMRLGDRALESVCGGHVGRYLAKGIGAGLLAFAPVVVPTLIGAKDNGTVALATAGVTWGALAGWAGHVALKHGML